MADSKQIVRSVDKASEEYHEFVCSICAADDRNIGAVKYCTQCKEYLCSNCLKEHNRFPAMKVHQLLDMSAVKGKQPPPLPKEQCTVHLGNNLEIYCGNHDVVCCPTCVSLDHRSCDHISYTLDAARGVTDSQEYKTMKKLETSLGGIKDKLQRMKTRKQNNQSRLEKEKNACLIEIQDFRKQINNHLDDLEQEAKSEVHRKYKEYEDSIDSDIKTLEEMISTLETSISQMKKVNKDNEPQIFVFTKIGTQNENKGQQLAQEMKNTAKQEPLIFKLNTAMRNIIKDVKSLGDFVEADKEDQLYKASLLGRYGVKVKGETKCSILGSCLLPDGKLLITDCDNNKLKRLDQSYKVTDWCDLAGKPWGVCTTDPGEAAVVLGANKKIQFVSLGQRMIPTTTLEVGQCCDGVGYINGQLIVSCQLPGQISIYNKTGKLFRTFRKNTAGQKMFSTPRQIAISSDGTLVHVADKDNGAITLDLQRDKLSQFSDQSLVNARGVCTGDSGQLFVSGRDPHNVIQISRGGQKLAEILDKSNGVENPISLCYDPINSRLIVTMDSDHIAVFQLIKK